MYLFLGQWIWPAGSFDLVEKLSLFCAGRFMICRFNSSLGSKVNGIVILSGILEQEGSRIERASVEGKEKEEELLTSNARDLND